MDESSTLRPSHRGAGPEAFALIDRLIDRQTLALRATDAAVARSTIESLEALGEPAVIPWLLLVRLAQNEPGPWDRVRSIVQRSADPARQVRGSLAVEAAVRLTLRVMPSGLAPLERLVRGSLAWRVSASQAAIEATLAEIDPALAVGFLGIASWHPDGHVREWAVRGLARCTDERAIRFLLLRLDDWVPQVRSPAVAAAQARLTADSAAAFVAALPLLRALGTRVRSTPLVDWIERWLLQPQFRTELLRGLSHPDRFVRRATLACYAKADQVDLREPLEIALRDSDVATRLQAFALGRERLGAEERRWFAEALCDDDMGLLRAEGLALLDEIDPAAALPRLEAALLDRAAVVRGTARFLLRRRGLVRDWAAFYREASSSSEPRVRRAALASLGDLGSAAEDGDRIVTLLHDDTVGVVAAALRALGQLDPEAARLHAHSFLLDRRLGVAMSAASFLRTNRSPADLPALRRALKEAPQRAVRLLAIARMASLLRFDALGVLMESIRSDDPIGTAAREALGVWLRNYDRAPYFPPAPSPAERNAVPAAFALVASMLEKRERAAVEAILERHFSCRMPMP